MYIILLLFRKYQSQIIDSDEEDIKKDTDKDCKEVEYKVLSAKT